ncbi:MAG: hypothetical protein AAB847_00465 [Patescibacteria group bacterium]
MARMGLFNPLAAVVDGGGEGEDEPEGYQALSAREGRKRDSPATSPISRELVR